jgi:transcriptional regulator with XRE-family HTH domain
MEAKMIKMLLLLMGVKQKDIAKMVNVTPPHVNYVITGKRNNPKVRQAIAEAVHRPVDELWPGDGQPNKRGKRSKQESQVAVEVQGEHPSI